MSKDEFTRLFTYMERRFDDMGHEMQLMRNDINRVYGLLDVHIKRMETIEHEHLALRHQVERHEGLLGGSSGD